jgi:acyl-CoA thioesterase FadM
VSAPVPVFSRHRSIEESDLDALDHVNNVVWLRFMVELADAHSSAGKRAT